VRRSAIYLKMSSTFAKKTAHQIKAILMPDQGCLPESRASEHQE